MTSKQTVGAENALASRQETQIACTVRELSVNDSDRWTAYVKAHPEATLYHTLPWRDFIQNVFRHVPMYLLCERVGEICGVLPLFLIKLPILGSKLISLPYDIGSGGVLGMDSDSELALVERTIELAQEMRVGYLQLRYGARRDMLKNLGLQESEPVLISRMRLENETQVRAGVAKDHRKAVRKAQNRGITIREADDLRDFRAFYEIYLQVFRSFGTPPYSATYFHQLWNRLHDTKAVRLLMAYYQHQPVGGLVLFCWEESLVSKFAACLPEAVPMRVYSALYWRAIEMGLELGYRSLSWGTSSRSQSGLIEFKNRWGAETHPVALYSFPVKTRVPAIDKYYDSNGAVQRIWKRLPLKATAKVGGIVSRWYC